MFDTFMKHISDEKEEHERVACMVYSAMLQRGNGKEDETLKQWYYNHTRRIVGTGLSDRAILKEVLDSE
jgi:hypothetical protein